MCTRFISIILILASCTGNVLKESAEVTTVTSQAPVDSLTREDDEKSDEPLVYVTHDGEKYHTADCRYSKNAHTVTLKQAKSDGKTACDLCKPNSKTGDKQIRCSAKTADGSQCKRMTTSATGKCFQHDKP